MQFSINFTADFLKRSYARRMFSGWWKIAIAAVLVVAVVSLDALRGAIGAASIVGMCGLALYFIIAWVAWKRQSKTLDEWLHQQEGEPVIYSLSVEAIESNARIGSTNLKWEAFRRLSIGDSDTLLFYSEDGALTLPTGQVPVEALEFVKKQLRAYGKKVEDRRSKGVTPVSHIL